MEKITKGSRLNKILLISLIVLSFMVSSLAFADGDTRKTTQAERAFIKSILNTFAKVVPPGPADWDKTVGSTEIKEPDYISDNENQPLRLEYRIGWQDTKRINDADIKQQEELIKMINQKKVPTDEEINELQKKMAPHDVEAKIELYANLTSQGIYEKVAPAATIAGGLVYRSQSLYRNGWKEGSTYVFFGSAWKMTSSSSSGTYIDFKPEKKGTSSTVVQNIVVKIQADPKRAEGIIQKFDWEALKNLIKN